MNTDFVVMVRQAHHERHCILSLSKDQSNDYKDYKNCNSSPQRSKERKGIIFLESKC